MNVKFHKITSFTWDFHNFTSDIDIHFLELEAVVIKNLHSGNRWKWKPTFLVPEMKMEKKKLCFQKYPVICREA